MDTITKMNDGLQFKVGKYVHSILFCAVNVGPQCRTTEADPPAAADPQPPMSTRLNQDLDISTLVVSYGYIEEALFRVCISISHELVLRLEILECRG